MSPEVAFKRPYTENIDIWSLGVLLYEMTHGYSVFKAKTLTDVTNNLKNIEKIHFMPELSNEIKSLIQSILRLEPEKRFNLGQIFSHDWMRRREEGGERKKEGERREEEGERRRRRREEERREEDGWKSVNEGGRRKEWMRRKVEDVNMERRDGREEEGMEGKKDGKEEGRKEWRGEEGRKEGRGEEGRDKRKEGRGEEGREDASKISNVLKERKNYIPEQNKITEEEKEFSKPYSKLSSQRLHFSTLALNQNKENLEVERKNAVGKRREDGRREEGRREEGMKKEGWHEGEGKEEEGRRREERMTYERKESRLEGRSKSRIFEKKIFEETGDLMKRIESFKTLY